MSKIKIEQNLSEIVISYRWFRTAHLFMLFFFIAWDSFLFFWYSMSFSSGFWIASIFPIAHVAVGVGGTYFVLTGLFNRTTLRLNKKELRVRSYPLPWIGSHKTVQVKEITQFYMKQKINSGKNGASYTYQLRYLDKNQNDKSLLPMGVSMDEYDVQKMERLFEEYLGIKDFSVPGEHGDKSFQTITSKKEFKVPINRPVNNDPLNRNLLDLQINGFVDYNLESFHVDHGWQYDVDAGKSYKLFSGKSTISEASFFFEVGGGNMILVEKEIPSIMVKSKSPINVLPKELSVGDELFKHSQTVRCMKFNKSSKAPMFEAELAFYLTEDFEKVLRIELNHGQIESINLGETEKLSSFSGILPPSE